MAPSNMAGDKADTARRSADPAQKIQPEIPHILPHEKVFPIQIGSELFRLSGASISSDGTHYPFLPPPPFLSSSASPSPSRGASELQRSGNKTQTENPRAPSYFSSFFRCQLDKAAAAAAESSNGNGSGADGAGIDCNAIRTLYIDRDPGTFRDIAQHLQGYHIQPRDGAHFVRLFADAQFYQCKSPPWLVAGGASSPVSSWWDTSWWDIPHQKYSSAWKVQRSDLGL
jgi:hypothetical protein